MLAGRANELPTGKSMPVRRADVMSTSVVDVDRKVDEWRIPKCQKSRNVNSRNSRRSRKFGRTPERGKVGG
jgi:hypothetical protein